MIRIVVVSLFFTLFVSQLHADTENADIQKKVITDKSAPDNPLSFSMKKDADNIPNIQHIIAVLFLLIIAAILVIFLLKRLLLKNNDLLKDTSRIVVSSSKKISLKTVAHLIKIDEKQYLVIEKDNAVSILEHK